MYVTKENTVPCDEVTGDWEVTVMCFTVGRPAPLLILLG
jgi:hypothetical protein